MKIYDLTHFIEEGMSTYSEEEKANIENLSIIKSDGYNVKKISLSNHTGTHIDLPNHIFEDGNRLEDIRLEKFIGSAFILDCRNIKQISKEYILKNIDDIKKYNYIIFKTGAEKLWKKEEYLNEYSFLTEEATNFLGNIEEIYGIGVDCISVDASFNHNLTNHKILLSKNKIIIENLCGLENLSGEYEIIIAPLKIKEADGSPSRIFLIKK
ncbi:cyclase family protein [Clostridium thermobutyricum]|uniref:cyclase family protein n=1 Tax=Clostridium thermobutyricum TaxID=29372 RepID=UPI003F525FF3